MNNIFNPVNAYMVFSSFIFLFVFLPLALVGYYLLPFALRNIYLVLASIVFYMWGAPQIVPFLLISCTVDFFAAGAIHRKDDSSSWRPKILFAAIACNLSLLLYYKYANFFIEQTNVLRAFFHLPQWEWTHVLLPIGISFFTFHKISYLVDVYRRKITPANSWIDYLLYVLFFPQLVAGPIIRYFDIGEQIRSRKESLHDVSEGMFRFLHGLAKKILIADSLGGVADTLFEMPDSTRTVEYAWLGMFCYSFQIFFDFSGYSDMAIGLARMFGFRFKENFADPYRSATFTEFWRRWHISLSSWMREYLYFPLGGNRLGPLRTYANLWIVFLLSGLWHGASWNFILWGAYHGLFLVLDRLFWERMSARMTRLITVPLTFLFVSFGWVFFRAADLPSAINYFATLFGLQNITANLHQIKPIGMVIEYRSMAMLVLATVLVFFISEKTKSVFQQESTRGVLLRGACSMLLFLLATASLAAQGYTPFLYFRF